MGKHRDNQRRKAHGARKRNAQSPNAKWRSHPATESQWNVLRKVGRETGIRFAEDITRGQASEVHRRTLRGEPGVHGHHRREGRGMSKPSPWTKWHTAASKQFRFKVDSAPETQAKAWTLIERGACAYQNRAGLICDVAVPKKPKHRGKVFAFTEEAANESEAA